MMSSPLSIRRSTNHKLETPLSPLPSRAEPHSLRFVGMQEWIALSRKPIVADNITHNATAYNEVTPARRYVQIGYKESLEKCLRHEDVNQQDEEGWTLLMLAIYYNQLPIVEFLLTLPTIDLELRDKDNWTALHFAVNLERHEMTQRLLEKGANIWAVDDNEETSFDHASYLRNKTLKETLNKSARKLKEHEYLSSLIIAAQLGHNYVIKRLLKLEFDSQECDENGKTALQHALEFGQIESARLLAEKI